MIYNLSRKGHLSVMIAIVEISVKLPLLNKVK